MTAILEAARLTAGYGDRPVVEEISFALEPGRTLAVTGPNAAGKSTLLRALIGLLPPLAGEARLDGRSLLSIPLRERARRIALVPQSVRFDIDFTVREVVALGRSPRFTGWGFETAEDRRMIDCALEELDLSPLAPRPFAEISGGERQRVLLARARAQEAELWLLDEPTAHLDLAHQLLVMEQVAAHRARGGSAIVVLHDLALAMRLDEAAVLQAGRLAALGPPAAVLDSARLAATWGIDASLQESDGAWTLAMRGRRPALHSAPRGSGDAQGR